MATEEGTVKFTLTVPSNLVILLDAYAGRFQAEHGVRLSRHAAVLSLIQVGSRLAPEMRPPPEKPPIKVKDPEPWETLKHQK